jgi:hypothetical protein
VVVIGQIAMVANAVVAEDAVAADAAVEAGVKAGIVRVRCRAEHPRASVRNLPGQKTRLLRNPRPCRRVTVLIAMGTLATGTLDTTSLPKRRASGSRTIDRRYNRNSDQRNLTTRRRNLSTGSRCHTM